MAHIQVEPMRPFWGSYRTLCQTGTFVGVLARAFCHLECGMDWVWMRDGDCLFRMRGLPGPELEWVHLFPFRLQDNLLESFVAPEEPDLAFEWLKNAREVVMSELTSMAYWNRRDLEADARIAYVDDVVSRLFTVREARDLARLLADVDKGWLGDLETPRETSEESSHNLLEALRSGGVFSEAWLSLDSVDAFG